MLDRLKTCLVFQLALAMHHNESDLHFKFLSWAASVIGGEGEGDSLST